MAALRQFPLFLFLGYSLGSVFVNSFEKSQWIYDLSNARLDVDDPTEEIKFYLFTRSNINSGQRLNLSDSSSIASSFYNDSLPIKIAIHGFTEGLQGVSIQDVKNAYLEAGDYNVIGVDWEKLAAPPTYDIAANSTELVGQQLALLIDTLVNDHNAVLSNIHIIGFSLGAHAAGVAGQLVTVGKLSRISGLDPAYPLFPEKPESLRLDPSDAVFVDVIHTSGSMLGYADPLGTVDFYPNGGGPIQPGCKKNSGDVFAICSHFRAEKFFAESVTSNVEFNAVPCDSWDDFLNNTCAGVEIPMGDPCPSSAQGIYYLTTNDDPPYAQG